MVFESELNAKIKEARINALQDALNAMAEYPEDLYSDCGGNFDDAYQMGVDNKEYAIQLLLDKETTP